MLGGVFVHRIQGHPWRIEKYTEFPFVLFLPVSPFEPGKKLAQGYSAQSNVFRSPQNPDKLLIAAQRSGINIGVDEYSVHFQS